MYSRLSQILKEFLIPKIRFGVTSLLATIIDIALFTIFLVHIFEPINAERIAAGVGMIINFFLQKKYVFNLQRNSIVAFVLSIAMSIIFLEMGAQIINLLTRDYLSYDLWEGFSIQFENPYASFFMANIIIAKLISVFIKFGCNFYTKRWIFEKKKISLKKYRKEAI